MNDKFYTNVQISRNDILVRGHDSSGTPFKERIAYQPTHYVKSQHKDSPYKTLFGEPLDALTFESITEGRNFIYKYEGMHDTFPIYGYPKYIYNYISENFRSQTPNLEAVSVVYFDIEVCGNHYEPNHVVRLEDDTVTTIGELRFYPDKKVWDETKSQYIAIENSSYYKPNGFPKPEEARNPINAISLRKGEQIWILTTLAYETHRDDVDTIICKDEKELLAKFVKLWRELDPEIISSWNGRFFDIPYIVNRLTKVFGEQAAKKLSPWGLIRPYTEKTKYGKEQQSYHIIGISDIDLMVAYIKFSFKNHESFSLNYISHIELGEKKVSYAEFDNIHLFYLKDPQKYIEYNIQDTDLVFKINKKTGLINQIMELAYSAGVNYEDAFTSVLFWEVKIKNKLETRNIIVPGTRKHEEKTRQNIGAFVKPVKPGLYKWVISQDLDSLYPHCIMEFNISPETLVDYKEELSQLMPIEDILNGNLYNNETIRKNIKERNLAYTPNGCFFKKDIQGILSEMMEEDYALRKQYKSQMLEYKKQNKASPTVELEALISKYNNMQMARKISINALYGVASNEFFLFYDLAIAEAITLSGQLIIKYVSNKFNEFFNKILKTKNIDFIIANDTDSCYLNLDLIVKHLNVDEPKKIVKSLVKFCNDHIQTKLTQWFEEFAVYINAYKNKLHMKTENIAEAAVWKAKKRYFMNVWWSEGVTYTKPELKITGIEAISSTSPAICRDAIKDCLKLILKSDKQGLYSYVREFEKKFRQSTFEEIASTSGVTDMMKYYTGTFPVYAAKSHTPVHVRAALLYNYYIRKFKVNDVYQDISNGDKLKYCYLKIPNPIHENIIGIYNKLPSEFGLEKYIDYDKQFETEFINPVNSIAKILKWDIVNNESILDFME